MKAIYKPFVGEPVRVELVARYQNKVSKDDTWYVEIRVLTKDHEHYTHNEVLSVNINRLWLDVKWNDIEKEYVYSRPIKLEQVPQE